jgi:hypothetical protein
VLDLQGVYLIFTETLKTQQMFNEVTILAQTDLSTPSWKKRKQVNTKMKAAYRRGWEINKILLRPLQAMSLVSVVFMCVRIGGCEDISIQYFITKAIKGIG